jgi:phosphoenolpyruvate synthase/pyruvate phosphate dikinase
MHVRPLADLRAADAALFGGKSASLGELIAAGIPVPPGFAASTAADVEEIADAYRALGEPAVAVRSSAIGEDSAETTFAGLQDTYLWVEGVDRVRAAARDCWASLDNPEAVAYRKQMGIEDKPAMGLTVQLMVDAAVSGVMFTCNPVSGDPSTVSVNASWGLGQAVIEYGPGGERSDVPIERQDAACLDEQRLAELVEVARRVERHFGCHQDIEWAIDRDGELFLLQSRPVTVLARAERPAGKSAIDLVMKTFGAKS